MHGLGQQMALQTYGIAFSMTSPQIGRVFGQERML